MDHRGSAQHNTGGASVAKLIYSTIASLDGYVEYVSGKFDWAAPDEEVHGRCCVGWSRSIGHSSTLCTVLFQIAIASSANAATRRSSGRASTASS